MAANVEIKARISDLAAVKARAFELDGKGPTLLRQEDTFFHASRGRLKLRKLAPDHGELIFYERPDTRGPKCSQYSRVPTDDPDALREALSAALGVAGTVRKTRWLYLVGRTRVHVDDVEELGTFLELEVILAPDETTAVGEREARDLMARLGIADADLVARAYVDLLND